MAGIHWVKLSTEMFSDEKIRVLESSPSGSEICLIWIKLIVLAGKVNDNGCIYLTKDIPYTESMLAGIFNQPVEIVQLALGSFVKLGMIEVLDNRRIALVNWEKHQNVEGLDRVRELAKLRTQKYRQKLLECNVVSDATVTSRDSVDLDSELELDKEKSTSAHKRSTISELKPSFNFTIMKWDDITDEMVKLWEIAYPACDIENELAKMASWLLANPKKRKTANGYPRFITSWLSRAQDKGGSRWEP